MLQIEQKIKNAQLLIVDDEPANVLLVKQILTKAGFLNLDSTQDPREVMALHAIKQYDLILLDLNMPELDGFGLMDQFRNLPEEKVPSILVLTAQNDMDHRLRALDSGARDFLCKPFDLNELTVRVRNLLEVQLFHNFLRNQNKLLEERVRDRTKELVDAQFKIQQSRLQVIRRLGRAAEFRDNETGLHIIRMSKTAELLARSAGLGDYQCELLLNASPMHDIGKIGIPDYILLKPGKLNENEWEIMKSHAQIGADILAGDDSDLLVMARDIAISHHEKWDGSGYPKGLSGEDIPFVGRVTALSDVFDALTSERPYKKAWPVEEAIQYMQDNRGLHFEPRLVDIFMEVLPQILEIRETYAEPDDIEIPKTMRYRQP